MRLRTSERRLGSSEACRELTSPPRRVLEDEVGCAVCLAGGEHRRFNAHDADVQNALAGDFRNVYAAEFVAMLSAVRVLVYEGDFDFEVRSPPISRRSHLEASALRRRG